MQNFWLYFEIGWKHICDWQGYDHILFVTVLCGIYLLKDWRKILILVTAFTIGHTITLGLSVYNLVKIPTNLVEFLIPVTILITAVSNMTRRSFEVRKIKLNYFLALLFGLIHGMGFSNYLKSMLGKNSTIIAELFAFNIGLEVGQITIVILVLMLCYFVLNILKIKRREWNLFLSSAIFGIALVMAIERFSTLM
ncbi:MAG: HupE/UreJ family protein [Daejeonella sp.]